LPLPQTTSCLAYQGVYQHVIRGAMGSYIRLNRASLEFSKPCVLRR
jgi:hypothetical protein